MTAGQPFDFFVQWHLTGRCNLRCRHCYQQDYRSPAELDAAAIALGIDEAVSAVEWWRSTYGLDLSLSFTLTGGEPFLRPDLFDIIRLIRGRGLAVSLLSNGTLIDRNRARRLADLGVNAVQISMEGPEAVNDGIRGKGSFASALNGARRLAGAGLPVTLNITLSLLNADTVADLMRRAEESGIARIGFSRLVPAGRGLELARQMIPPERLGRLYRDIFSRPAGTCAVVTGDPVAGLLLRPPPDDEGGEVAVGGCAAGISGITILADGTLLPCRRLPLPLGNITTDSLRDIWATSPILTALRSKGLYRGRCGRCPRWDICRGCRAVAWAASRKGDYLAEDPQCFFPSGRKAAGDRVRRRDISRPG